MSSGMSSGMSNLPGKPVFVVDGCRTPFLRARGRPGPFSASDLAVACGGPLLARQTFSPDAFNHVVLGCAAPGYDEANIARVVALRLGCGNRVPAWTVMRNCGSGMQALDSAALEIASGRADLLLAGGTEALSHTPILFGRNMVEWLADWSATRSLTARIGLLARLRPGHFAPVIGVLRGLTDPICGLSMGQTAENLATRFGITRQQMDAYAVESHLRLAMAQEQGWLAEVETVFGPDGTVYQRDDGVRPDTSIERLARLAPVFDRPYGAVTAGNSSQITDGAAWLILASEETVNRHDLPVLGRIIDSQWAGNDPAQMGLGPVYAMAPLLRRRRLSLADIDTWEINEAFAAQVLACLAALRDTSFCRDELGWDHALGEIDPGRLNTEGGAISLGHPVGASGARIVLHALHGLRRSGGKRAIATLCIGGGQGGAMLLEAA